MAEDQIPSKLHRRAAAQQGAPLRGIGAGIPDNQRMAGVQEAEAAAALASLSPDDARKRVEAAQTREQRVEELREDLRYALGEDHWSLPSTVPGSSDPDLVITEAPAKVIVQWHKDMVAERERRIDEDAEVDAELLLQDRLRVQPDDVLYDPIRDKARRKYIEERLKPLDFGEMVFTGYVDQVIELREEFTITLRTISTQQGLWMEEYIATQEATSQQHIQHWFSLLQVAISLVHVNGKQIGPDMSRIEDKEHFWKALEEKMKIISRYPGALTDDFICQYSWFVGRVRKLLAGNLARKVGNS
jgi:hypothetical protein